MSFLVLEEQRARNFHWAAWEIGNLCKRGVISLANASRHMLPHPKQINAQFIVSRMKKLWENHKILTLCAVARRAFERQQQKKKAKPRKCGVKMET